ncbi:MAG TPA: hypothetical protein VFA80_10365 [Xanthobacteraceae bacterium]|nr:hypothetical protein [Xanthobacteraceae bacterium]
MSKIDVYSRAGAKFGRDCAKAAKHLATTASRFEVGARVAQRHAAEAQQLERKGASAVEIAAFFFAAGATALNATDGTDVNVFNRLVRRALRAMPP